MGCGAIPQSTRCPVALPRNYHDGIPTAGGAGAIVPCPCWPWHASVELTLCRNAPADTAFLYTIAQPAMT